MVNLRPYQAQGIDSIAKNFSSGIRKQVFQLPTGGGKTITFAGMVQRYLAKFNKKVVILVHREELLLQTKNTLQNFFRIPCATLTADVKSISSCQVTVAMVETANNRLKKNPKYFGDVGMLIVDECHIGNFKKIYNYFHGLIIGFSATPISGNKKDPLRLHFEEIVTGPNIQELIDLGSLAENETYSLKGITRAQFKVVRGEFDIKEMSAKYSNSKNVQNTVKAFEQLCNGEKTMVFNCNIEHSKLVNDAFVNAGYNSKHLDGNETTEDRKKILHWFKTTENAILNNIAVLTTGFDEPTVKNIIINRSTMSLSLWLQMTGRGSRPVDEFFIIQKQKEYPYKLSLKNTFRIIDMGGNTFEHGDWRDSRDWSAIFHKPEKVFNTDGEAPVKACKGCEAIIPAQAVTCQYCGYVHERIITYDMIAPEFEKLVEAINVPYIINQSENQKPFAPFYKILGKTITGLKHKSGGEEITEDIKIRAFDTMEAKIKEWRRLTDQPYSKHTQEFAWKQFNAQIYRINKQRLVNI